MLLRHPLVQLRILHATPPSTAAFAKRPLTIAALSCHCGKESDLQTPMPTWNAPRLLAHAASGGLAHQAAINSNGNTVTQRASPLAQDSLPPPIRGCANKHLIAQQSAGTSLAFT